MVALALLTGDVKNYSTFSHKHLGMIPHALRREAVSILMDSPHYADMPLVERAALVAWSAAKLVKNFVF
ncbi:MAG: hypothetical protein WC643_02920 [Parcubacteria group bacterium]|jgi:hypothetical protein